MHRSAVLVAALALLAAACSSSAAGETTTTTTSTTTTTAPTTTTTTSTTTLPPTTTTTVVEIGDSINGLPAPAERTRRRAVAVKVDNHPLARPHSGLQEADAIYELLVEGGLTRFIVLFHQSDSSKVGPVRSLRPTDPTLTIPLGAPLQISGAAFWVMRYVRSLDTPLLIDDGTATFRDRSRKAPHNLYADTTEMRARSDDKGYPDDPPPQLFRYGPDPTPLEAEATTIELPFSEYPPSTFVWDGESYLHFYGDEPHTWVDEEGNSGQVSVDQVVVVKGRQYIARPPKPSDGKAVPATDVVGKGDGLVFRDGGVLPVTWERGSLEDPLRFFDLDGEELVMPPGRVWIAVFPRDRVVTWR